MKIIRDTREREGFWDFPEHTISIKKLDTGDYSLIGYENIICIERKKSVSEIAINIGKDKVRFFKELERMKDFKLAYIVCEFSTSDILNFPPPEYKDIKIKGKYILSSLSSLEKKYGVKVIYCNSREEAMEKVLEIFEIAESLYEKTN